MAYIGKEPIVGNFQVCDAISVVNGQAAYTMQVSSTNVVPESVNHMLVSLNGILQKPGSSFTISGSTITFASALATGDVIDFIMLLGNVLDLGVPSDATVTDAKANFVSTSSAAGLQIKGDGTTDGTLQLNCSQNSHGIKLASPAHSAGQSYKLIFPSGNVTAGKFLKVDSVSGSGTTGIGTMTFADAGGSMASGFANTDVNQTIQSNTLTDLTNVTASITPSSTSSKVLIVGRVQSHSSGYGIGLGIVRDSTVIYEDEGSHATYSGDSEYVVSPFSFIDSPSTTSSTTYKVQVKTYGSASHTMQAGGDSNICLVEILG
jgi:hypothetical protein